MQGKKKASIKSMEIEKSNIVNYIILPRSDKMQIILSYDFNCEEEKFYTKLPSIRMICKSYEKFDQSATICI